jgi:hypothetical protein
VPSAAILVQRRDRRSVRPRLGRNIAFVCEFEVGIIDERWLMSHDELEALAPPPPSGGRERLFYIYVFCIYYIYIYILFLYIIFIKPFILYYIFTLHNYIFRLYIAHSIAIARRERDCAARTLSEISIAIVNPAQGG